MFLILISDYYVTYCQQTKCKNTWSAAITDSGWHKRIRSIFLYSIYWEQNALATLSIQAMLNTD